MKNQGSVEVVIWAILIFLVDVNQYEDLFLFKRSKRTQWT